MSYRYYISAIQKKILAEVSLGVPDTVYAMQGHLGGSHAGTRRTVKSLLDLGLLVTGHDHEGRLVVKIARGADTGEKDFGYYDYRKGCVVPTVVARYAMKNRKEKTGASSDIKCAHCSGTGFSR